MALPKSANHRFIQACKGQPVDCTPVWLMRQAGRYMAEYRALRKKYTILEMIHAPELAAEVTLQPLHAFDLDAGIIFADILPLVDAMGLDLNFISGTGPVFSDPIRSPADVERLDPAPVRDELKGTFEAVKLVSRELDGRLPLIGFSGAPFTLACYAIEGRGSTTFATARAFMVEQPEAWGMLMDKLVEAIAGYMQEQVHAGASALQLFDSWAARLSAGEYAEHVLPWSRKLVQQVRSYGVPLIHFSTGDESIAEQLFAAGGDVIGVGSSVDLPAFWERTGYKTGIQGNLDSDLLMNGPVDAIRLEAEKLLKAVNGRPGFIFNLGHGIIKHTPVEHVEQLVQCVHAFDVPSPP